MDYLFLEGSFKLYQANEFLRYISVLQDNKMNEVILGAEQ